MPADPSPSDVQLFTLGAVGLRRGGAELSSVLVQPKRVALLAYLAIARPRGFHPRSSLLALLWPEHDERHARWAMNQALCYLRNELGSEAIRSRGRHDVGVEPRTAWCDAVAFETACDESRWDEALELYRGELLHGLYVPGCGDFERWLDGERARLRALAARAAWALTDEAEAARDVVQAVSWARRAVALSPHDEAGARRMIRLLDGAGDRAGAIHAYEEYASWLGDQFDIEPAPETQALLSSVRSRTQASGPRPTSHRLPDDAAGAAPPQDAPAPLAAPGRASARPRRRARRVALGAGALVVVAVLGSWAFWRATRGVIPPRPSPVTTTDARALELYRDGRRLLSQVAEPAVRQGIYRFNDAIARDSLFAAAHAGLGAAYMLLGRVHGSMDPREAFPLARQAALRAVALDDGLAGAHTLLGLYEVYYGWDWATAERELRRAIHLDPNEPSALRALAFYLTLAGRYDEVPALHDRAIALDPFNPDGWADAGSHAMLAGRYDDGLELLERAFALTSEFHPLLLIAGILHAELGDTPRALEYLQRADTLSHHQEIVRGRLGWAYALHGDTTAARAILRELKDRAVGPDAPAKTATAAAVVHMGLGEPDSAFAWLEVGYERRASNLVRVLRTPAGLRLAADPRYQSLLDRIGLRPVVLTPALAELGGG